MLKILKGSESKKDGSQKEGGEKRGGANFS